MLTLLLSVVILAGIEGSYNYGEESPGGVFQAAYEHRLGEARVFGSTMNKVESHAGYTFGADADFHPRVGPLIGVGWRYRDGGSWSKTSTWLRGGLAIDYVTAVLAWDLMSENSVRLGELRGRWDYGGFCLEQRFGLARYNSSEVGLFASMSVGKEF